MFTRDRQAAILSHHALYLIAGHTAAVRSVAWSPNGQVLASGSGDQTVRLWNGQTGEQLQVLEGHTDRVNSVAWSPDGKIFVSQSDTNIASGDLHRCQADNYYNFYIQACQRLCIVAEG